MNASEISLHSYVKKDPTLKHLKKHIFILENFENNRHTHFSPSVISAQISSSLIVLLHQHLFNFAAFKGK